MVRSMTGFGRGEATGPAGRLTLEVKAVNHRFSEVVARLPRQLSALEERVRKDVLARIARGRVDVFVAWDQTGTSTRRVKVDKDLAVAYHSALKELGEAIGSTVEISAEMLGKLPDVLTIEEKEVNLDALGATMSEALGQALDGLLAMREREGNHLAADLRMRVDHIEQLAQGISRRAPQVVDEYRQRLQRRLEELLGNTPVEPGRLAQEVAIFADKSDITEELKRLGSHLAQFRSGLDGQAGEGDAAAAVGRRLDFLVQELVREINTIGSKANEPAISASVVEAKSELEKIREQVQNIE